MRFLCALLLAATAPAQDFRVQVADVEMWRPLLSSVGIEATSEPTPYRILVGDDPAAERLGFIPTGATVRVAAVVDAHDRQLEIFWKEPRDVAIYSAPEEATVFATERHSGAPLVVGVNQTLWAAVPPGERGYERFPYLLHALVDLGFEPPFRGDRLWAFFDSSYRLRADPDYLARQWRNSGIGGLHVAAWHYYEPDTEKAAYLRKLLEACRKQGILVYAWLELPHVSEGFWNDHPSCREKTATLQDAKLDWRKLINLVDKNCSTKVRQGIRRLLTSFGWDGVNLGELYFESLHGPDNPARFTPMNKAVRFAAKGQLGFDPLELFEPGGERHFSKQQEAWHQFVDYRAELALALQEEWLDLIRETLPEAEVVVTQIDDRFDTRMRELLGADTAALLPLAERYDFTLLIEDPAPLWSLGPERYTEIARRYQPLADSPERLAIDINIVERYQQTYPTRKQTGSELLELVDRSSRAFPQVALYFENSIERVDRLLLPHAASAARLVESSSDRLIVESARPFGVLWEGPANVNGEPWPFADGETVWLPAGRHVVRRAEAPTPAHIVRFGGEVGSVAVDEDGVVFGYRSSARAIALLDQAPTQTVVDGEPIEPDVTPTKHHWSLRLPRGKHEVRLRFSRL